MLAAAPLHSCSVPAAARKLNAFAAAARHVMRPLPRSSSQAYPAAVAGHQRQMPTCSSHLSASSQRRVAARGSVGLAPYVEELPAKLTPAAKRVTDFALRFAHLTETYEVHTWFLVLGLLQVKDGVAAEVLRDKGISDFHEAFLEVLYCLKMADALSAKGFRNTVTFTNRAVHVLEHARYIARSLGHSQVDTEHILAALAYYEVPQALFPDLALEEEAVWKAINIKWEAKGMASDVQLLDKHTRKFEEVFSSNPARLAYFPDLKRVEDFDFAK